MIQETENKFLKNLVLIIIRFVINYIEYFFLTGSVIFSLVVLLFVILNINPNFSFDFIQYFSFLNPTYKTGAFSMGIKETMEIFSVLAFIFMIILASIKILLKKVSGIDIYFTLKSRALFFFAIITLVYISAFFIIAFSDKLDKGFYFVFTVFYISNLICIMLHLLFAALSEKITELFIKEPQM